MFEFSPLKKWLNRQERQEGPLPASTQGTEGENATSSPSRPSDQHRVGLDTQAYKLRSSCYEGGSAQDGVEMDDLVLLTSAASSTGAGVASLAFGEGKQVDCADDLNMNRAGGEDCESSIDDSAFGADDILRIGITIIMERSKRFGSNMSHYA
jgi:hypothetical protein